MPRRPRPKHALPSPVQRPHLLAGESLLPPPRQERSRRKREALLDATLATFAERGYEASTIDEIGRRAGVAVGGFYLHFRSKRQALLVLMDRLLGELDGLAPALEADLQGTVVALVRDALRLDMAYLGAYRAWREAVLRDDELALLHASIDAWTTGRLATWLELIRAAPSSPACSTRSSGASRSCAWESRRRPWTPSRPWSSTRSSPTSAARPSPERLTSGNHSVTMR